MQESSFSAVFVGQESLLIQCASTWLQRGHSVEAVVSASSEIRRWAEQTNIRVLNTPEELLAGPRASFDYLFSVTHLSILPESVVKLPVHGAVNFHDGPLPTYAGLNVTTWAILNGESQHAVSWHVIESTLDTGAVLESQSFDIAPDETAFSLNTKCYEAGMSSFGSLVARLESGTVEPIPQHGQRHLYTRAHRPPSAGILLPSIGASEQVRMIRALDYGAYDNPVALARLPLADRTVLIQAAETTTVGSGNDVPPGTIVGVDASSLSVSTPAGTVRYTAAIGVSGDPIDFNVLASDLNVGVGDKLPTVSAAQLAEFERLDAAAARGTAEAARRLTAPQPLPVPFAVPSAMHNGVDVQQLDQRADEKDALSLAASLAVFLGRLADTRVFDVWLRSDGPPDTHAENWSHALRFDYPVRLRFDDRGQAVADAIRSTEATFRNVSGRALLHRDITARYAAVERLDAALPDVVIDVGDSHAAEFHDVANALCLRVAPNQVTWEFSSARLDRTDVERMQNAFGRFLVAASDPSLTLAQVSTIDDAERDKLLRQWNATERAYDEAVSVHGAFEAQAERTPEAPALSWGGGSMTYRELDERGNRLAHVLGARGIKRGDRVGVCTDRSADMLISVLGVLKAGAAYVPLDPDFPADRVRYMIEDATLRHVICQADTQSLVSGDNVNAFIIDVDTDALDASPSSRPAVDVHPDNLAYVIYTSGSTGRPKGVMVTHRNVANFFAGMDDLIPRDRADGQQSRWLAVTSLSFDISVLELLWTLAGGFEVVLAGAARTAAAPPPIDFSLFFFSSGGDSEPGPQAYRLLFESAEFADQHGFVAVWTPERHFHAFGGLFPNPSVVSAALAARTNNIQLRAGSCVSPLHHPIRVAEEWSVVDNISGGRTGLAFASGWQPNDFVLMPQNFADRKTIMFEQIETIRALWRGETVSFPGHSGAPVEARTLPRPVQPDLPVWITTAGNPETFRMAGEAGYNVLTHLLGQSVDEIAEKIRHYRDGRKAAGHKGAGEVALMLHTFVHPDPDFVRDTVREPMKTYLRSAISLVKDAAWSFPTFKEKTIDEGGKFTMEHLTADEEDALLEHAFERYYKTSGLFGTPRHCLALIQELAGIGVDEVACLIDFGVETDETLGALEHLEALRALYSKSAGRRSASVAEIIVERNVTHLQCTPSMARMLVADEQGRTALSGLSHLCVGGEALPATLAASLGESMSGTLQNMYGPTETTIWSSVADLTRTPGDVTIGRPIANTRLYILDSDGQPVPTGLPGELYIGGDGVTAGYLDRPELTAERFVPDPFAGGLMYRTGDRCRYRPDGAVEFLGRTDNQTKIRGYRIELGEVEHELARLSGVRAAVAAVRNDVGDEPAIVGYVVEASNGSIQATFDADAALDVLRERLPEHMVPSRILTVSDFPMTPNGKVDRARLPAPSTRASRASASVAPQAGTEQLIAEVWASVLDVESVGADENFFDIGGHSLLAVQVNSRLAEALGRELSLIDFFRYPTVRTLAAHLSDAVAPDVAAVQAGASRADARRAARRRGR